ncbi:hypothetical protein DH2020_020065 [Rehmannia glutinosa]|uniref:Endonuclease/exonuclease/phosphatase domain-containing protein n=1 Tax=Rehmannia glutinosa TaxID=99300 RepID=A0ABR0WF25_REHGL
MSLPILVWNVRGIGNNPTSRFMGIYASLPKSTRVERRDLWNDLKSFTTSTSTIPWLVGGDFNCFLSPEERTGNHTNRTLDMIDFGQMISDCGLVDAGFEGTNMHTWARYGLMERLDRILLNGPWADLFPKSSVIHLPRVHSDHAPLLFQASLTINKPPAAFRYMKMWARHQYFLCTVAQVWGSPTDVSGLFNLHYKLIRVKQKMKWWNRNIFGNIFSNLKQAKQNVHNAERTYDSDPSPSNRTSLHQAVAQLVMATKLEEDYWN